MDNQLTRCPNCGTTFHVSQQHLQAANGNVRCGSCMKVFNAVQHMVNNQADEDEKLLDFDFADQKKANTKSEEEFSDSFLDLDRSSGSRNPFRDMDDVNGDSNKDNEDWTRALLDDEPAPRRKATPAADDDLLGEMRFDDTPLFDIDGEPSKTSAAKQAAAPSPAKAPEAPSFEEDFDDLFSEMDGKKQQKSRPSHAMTQRDSLIKHIEADPLELHIESGHWRALRRAAWIIISIIGLIALPAQIAWFKFDELSQEPQWRPWYAKICPMLGCELPKQENVHLIKASNLVVRSHHDRADALVVDAILTNSAGYDQPFPALELMFTNPQGEIVSGRRFSPTEYLEGELRGARSMRPRQPVHISLAIVDPGPQAVGYAIQLRANRSNQ